MVVRYAASAFALLSGERGGRQAGLRFPVTGGWFARVGLKIAFCQMCVPLCGRFGQIYREVGRIDGRNEFSNPPLLRQAPETGYRFNYRKILMIFRPWKLCVRALRPSLGPVSAACLSKTPPSTKEPQPRLPPTLFSC